MSKVIFNTIWGDKEKIIDIANQLISETIVEDDYSNEYEAEIQCNNKKIETNNSKLEKLLEMYLSDIIPKENYIKKKCELEKNIELLKKEYLKKLLKQRLKT